VPPGDQSVGVFVSSPSGQGKANLKREVAITDPELYPKGTLNPERGGGDNRSVIIIPKKPKSPEEAVAITVPLL
jgi:hypothetical protein